MDETVIDVLRHHPEVTFFLVLGLGYMLGRVKVAGFTVGAVTGALLAGIVVGQLGVTVAGEVKRGLFLLFLFAIGFRTGPQFVRALRREALQQAAVAGIVATTGLLVAYAAARLFGYDAGTAAGLLAGSLTGPAAIGTAGDAIERLAGADAAIMSNQIAVSFTITYLLGAAGGAWFLSTVAPRIIGIDLAEECRRYERELRAGTPEWTATRRDIEYRAYLVLPGSPLVGRRTRELEAEAAPERVYVERMRRGDALTEPDESTIVQLGDTLAIAGRLERRMPGIDHARLRVREVNDAALLDLPGEVLEVVVTSGDAEGRTLAQVTSDDPMRGIALRRVLRLGVPMAMLPATALHRGDIVSLSGPARRLAAAVEHLGVADRPADAADLALVAFGIVVGALAGIPAMLFGGVEFGLTVSLGVLLSGLLCGWLRSVRPGVFGRVPGATLWLCESAGLAGFLAVVGLDAGPEFFTGLETNGATLVVAGLATVVLPYLAAIAAGRWVFHMQPGVLLGACAGAGTAGPALAALEAAADSAVPTFGYAGAYAIGNVLVALWGTVIVALLL